MAKDSVAKPNSAQPPFVAGHTDHQDDSRPPSDPTGPGGLIADILATLSRPNALTGLVSSLAEMTQDTR